MPGAEDYVVDIFGTIGERGEGLVDATVCIVPVVTHLVGECEETSVFHISQRLGPAQASHSGVAPCVRIGKLLVRVD